VRLLVVEDETRLAGTLQRGLQAEGFAVDVATTGPAGLDAARHGGYDAMILDVMLPGLSGYELVRRLRAEEHWLPVLMLSAKDGEYDQADGLDCGADDYLTKPFSYVVLLARLRALLRRARGQARLRRRGECADGGPSADHHRHGRRGHQPPERGSGAHY